MKSHRLLCIVLLVGCGTNNPAGTATVSYNITDLGLLLPQAINNRDEVVGGLGDASFDNVHAAYWKGGTTTTLQGSTSPRDSANAINDTGQIAGHLHGSADGIAAQATLWESSTAAPSPLSSPASANNGFSDALGLDASGNAVGYGYDGQIFQHAILWKHAAPAVELSGLSGSQNNAAWSVNASGTIVGTSEFAGLKDKQVTWSASAPSNSTDLAIATTTASTTHVNSALIPSFVNASGAIAGTETDANGLGLAYVRSASGQVTSITGSSPTQSQSTGINASDIVIVDLNPDNVGSTPQAAVFDAVHGLRLLDSLVTPGSGWQLQFVTGINDSGKIVGFGQFKGATHGFLLTPIQ